MLEERSGGEASSYHHLPHQLAGSVACTMQWLLPSQNVIHGCRLGWTRLRHINSHLLLCCMERPWSCCDSAHCRALHCSLILWQPLHHPSTKTYCSVSSQTELGAGCELELSPHLLIHAPCKLRNIVRTCDQFCGWYEVTSTCPRSRLQCYRTCIARVSQLRFHAVLVQIA